MWLIQTFFFFFGNYKYLDKFIFPNLLNFKINDNLLNFKINE